MARLTLPAEADRTPEQAEACAEATAGATRNWRAARRSWASCCATRPRWSRS